jgi:hypothetical protein
MVKKHPEEEEKLVVVDEVHSSAREVVTDSAAETEDTEGESDKKPNMDLIVANGNSNRDMNHEEEKDDRKVEQLEVKTEYTAVQESNKVFEDQPQTDRKQETESSKDDLSSKEDSSLDHVNGTASAEVTSKVAMSPVATKQKKNKPLLKKFGSLLKKKNSK